MDTNNRCIKFFSLLTADIITALKDSLPIAVLTGRTEINTYQYLRSGPALNNGWWVEAIANNNDGIVDRVVFWNKDTKKIIVGNQHKSSNPEFIATKNSNNVLGALIFSTGSLLEFKAILLYDLCSKSIFAAGNYALDKNQLLSIFAKTENDRWIEYAFSLRGHKISAVALHDTLPGVFSKCMFDLSGDGTTEIQFGLTSARLYNYLFGRCDRSH